ncbi:MAG: hypothetical protein GXY48_13665 [Methanomicrobiales archaeon]|nr:hypothetical protein [Methanomicrobiales archaeon]
MNNIPQIRVIITTILFVSLIPSLICADSWSVSPGFDTDVSGSTSLVNMESFVMESKLKIRAVGEEGVPAGVEYMVSISPIPGTEAAIGTVRTDFRGFILESRGLNTYESERNEWRDQAMVSGAIVNFMKSFTYTSGISL